MIKYLTGLPKIEHASLTRYPSLISDILDKENVVDFISPDFSKAFDAVPHGKVLARLKTTVIKSLQPLTNWLQVGMVKGSALHRGV